MQAAVSTLGFWGPMILGMKALPPDIGIEAFYDWGGATYWRMALERLMDGRTGGFSVHAPYQMVDLSARCDERALFACLTEPFALYHLFRGEAYVVHPNAPLGGPPNPAEEEDRRKLAAERLAKLSDLCRREGVSLLVENMGFGGGKRTLFTQRQFLCLFAENPDLRCLYDTGHGFLERFDAFEIQQTLGNRLAAYHLHDNHGLEDEHLRIGAASIDWARFAEGARRFTPDATFVFECNPDPAVGANEYAADAAKLKGWLCA